MKKEHTHIFFEGVLTFSSTRLAVYLGQAHTPAWVKQPGYTNTGAVSSPSVSVKVTVVLEERLMPGPPSWGSRESGRERGRREGREGER